MAFLLISSFLVFWNICELSGNHVNDLCQSSHDIKFSIFFASSIELHNFYKCCNNDYRCHRFYHDQCGQFELGQHRILKCQLGPNYLEHKLDSYYLGCGDIYYNNRQRWDEFFFYGFDNIKYFQHYECRWYRLHELDRRHGLRLCQYGVDRINHLQRYHVDRDELDGTNYILVDDIRRAVLGTIHDYCASHDSFDDDYIVAALHTVPVALSSVAQAAVGTLCSGVNVSPAVSQPLPVTTGAYNYQKVQLNSFPSVYEVECWMNAGSTGGTVTNMPGQYFSLESCMDACSAAGPGSCLVAYWASTTRICSLYSRVNNGGSPSLAGGQSPAKIVGSGVRTARLLTGQPVPNVVDATYLLAPGADLGLCTNNNYHLTFIGVYYNGASGTGPATINVNRDNIWYASCGASFQNVQSGVQITPVYSIATPVFGLTSAPTTPDDCARVCQSYHSAFLLAANTGIDCNLWQFVPAATIQCQLYPSNAGVVSGSNPATLRDGQNNNIFAAGLLRGNSGTEFSSQAQYKKRSLAGRMEYNRRHARDSLIDDGSIPDVILKLDRRAGNWTEVL
ncbi:hypothetical protein AYO20_05878 [Fonsecaea nubica]|uniref:Apple domain-containing protein n=1 Tax=Fonsecaea nubica TaxID=856822 RepID=A0A178CZV1_9EURO|nr:hypothetical protein AYO20_05878 [Fonsecaea nubica]OAL34917.1 hypothetical protein AYO20_05878 [Fonsecaea nubica]